MLSDPPKVVAIILGATIGLLSFGIAYLVTLCGITIALARLEAGHEASIGSVYREMWSRIDDLVFARARAFGIIFLLSISIIGIPWAVKRSVEWTFLEQAIILDGADGRSAADVSRAAADGQLLRAFAVSAFFIIIGFTTGPIVTAPLLLFTATPLELLNAISSLIYMIVVPFAAVGLAVLYFDLKHEEGDAPTEGRQPS